MIKLAIVVDGGGTGVVQGVYRYSEDPGFTSINDYPKYIDVSTESPCPGPGWTYWGGVFSPPASVTPTKTVTGKEIFEFLSGYWGDIYDNIPANARWRWDRFVTEMGIYRDTQIKVTNTRLVGYFNALTPTFIPQADVDEFLGN